MSQASGDSCSETASRQWSSAQRGTFIVSAGLAIVLAVACCIVVRLRECHCEETMVAPTDRPTQVIAAPSVPAPTTAHQPQPVGQHKVGPQSPQTASSTTSLTARSSDLSGSPADVPAARLRPDAAEPASTATEGTDTTASLRDKRAAVERAAEEAIAEAEAVLDESEGLTDDAEVMSPMPSHLKIPMK